MKLSIVPTVEITIRYKEHEWELAGEAVEAICNTLAKSGMQVGHMFSGPEPVKPGLPECSDVWAMRLRISCVHHQKPGVAISVLQRAVNAEIPDTFGRIRRQAANRRLDDANMP